MLTNGHSAKTEHMKYDSQTICEENVNKLYDVYVIEADLCYSYT
jgi:hypothetical protein